MEEARGGREEEAREEWSLRRDMEAEGVEERMWVGAAKEDIGRDKSEIGGLGQRFLGFRENIAMDLIEMI